MEKRGHILGGTAVVRPVAPADEEAVWRIHSDPEVQRFNPNGPLTQPDSAATLLYGWLGHWDQHGHGYWAIAFADAPDTVIGFGGIRHGTWLDASVWNVYYRLVPTAWGRGIGRGIVTQSLQVWNTFTTTDRIQARTTQENVPSQRTALSGGLIRRPDLDVEHPRDGLEIVYARERDADAPSLPR